MTATLDRAPRFRPSPGFDASRYELGDELGKGGFGTVYACRDRVTGEKLACKVLNRDHVRRRLGKEASKEADIMKMLTSLHHGVIQIADVMEDETYCYIVMEYCSGGSLLEVLKANGAMPEASARMVLGQVAAALAFCHSQRVLHLDLKLDNVFFLEPATDLLYMRDSRPLPYHSSSPRNLLSQGPSSRAGAQAVVPQGLGTPGLIMEGLSSSLEIRTRLADFGMATCLKPGRKVRGDVGSSHFKAPEIVAGERFGLEVDVWSLGVVLCVMLTGTVPFLGTSTGDEEGLNRAILSGQVNFCTARWWGVPEPAQDLVRRMLQVDPAKRITASDVLAHPWLSGAEFPPEKELLPAVACEPAPPTATSGSSHHPKASLGPSPRPMQSEASLPSSGASPSITCTASLPSVHIKPRLSCAALCPRAAGNSAGLCPLNCAVRSSIHRVSVL